MAFELTIRCTKDINDLHINFADGSSYSPNSSYTEKVTPPTPNNISVKPRKESFLNTDEQYDEVFNEVVEKPLIIRQDKPAKVADELQNLDI